MDVAYVAEIINSVGVVVYSDTAVVSAAAVVVVVVVVFLSVLFSVFSSFRVVSHSFCFPF